MLPGLAAPLWIFSDVVPQPTRAGTESERLTRQKQA
jgi:hypothetical protein